jgi:hypothetical protein
MLRIEQRIFMDNKIQVRNFISTVQKLSAMDPRDEETVSVVASLDKMATELDIPTVASMEVLKSQVQKLHSAALVPANNYQRIVAITAGLHRALVATEKPQYASLRPRISKIVERVAGIFAEVDTVQDLDKPLEQIEKAVHALYGDQSLNSMPYFERRGKPNRPEPTDG